MLNLERHMGVGDLVRGEAAQSGLQMKVKKRVMDQWFTYILAGDEGCSGRGPGELSCFKRISNSW